MSIVIVACGGIALFLLAMLLMTEGLKVFAGAGLRELLSRWTATPLRGALTGVMLTGLVQSSSAVTISTIGFVNAGMLSLRQALGVVFGTNVGTTMTGWLVSLVGFGWKMESLALPILTVGVALRLLAWTRRYRGLGDALAGFGLFFLAVGLLRDAFADVAAQYGGSLAAGSGPGGPATFLLAGFVATVLTQSSSAAIAIILSAAAGGVVGIDSAAAAVIGANVGTTSTAALAALGATPAAKRLAIGHIAFNVITGAIAIAFLPAALALLRRFADLLDLGSATAPLLALFHTMFNVFGLLLLLPCAGWIADRLDRLFHSEDENLARPQFLDRTLASTPALAIGALRSELQRLAVATGRHVGDALRGQAGHAANFERQAEAIARLSAAIGTFTTRVQTEPMQSGSASDLAQVLQVSRHLNEAARLGTNVRELHDAARRLADPAARDAVLATLHAAATTIDIGATGAGAAMTMRPPVDEFRSDYAVAKAELLSAAIDARLSVTDVDVMLDHLTATRRLVERWSEAQAMLRTLAGASIAVVTDGHARRSDASVPAAPVLGRDPGDPQDS